LALGDLSCRIHQIERVDLRLQHPRSIGCNGRIGVHGPDIRDPVVRIHADNGAVGIGWAGRLDRDTARSLIGRPLADLFSLPDGASEAGRLIDLPLWDLAARLHDQPLYQLLGARGSRRVEVYDGSIYIDDLDADDAGAREIFRAEVESGTRFGFTNFKIKIGRGARWMPYQQGLDRDLLVIHAVREFAGPDAKVLIDANNSTVMNTACEILRQCEDVGIYWFEEPFPEDTAFNKTFKAFIAEQGYNTLVADGESGPPPPGYFDMVERGWIDVVQHDFHAYGLTWWKATADRIAPWGAHCGPHTWGSAIERFAHAHFAASVPNYSLLEAAPCELPGTVLDGWELRDGFLIVPDTPGTGFDLEPEVIESGVTTEGGFRVTAA